MFRTPRPREPPPSTAAGRPTGGRGPTSTVPIQLADGGLGGDRDRPRTTAPRGRRSGSRWRRRRPTMPSPRTAPRQPMRPMVSAAANPTTTVPMLPPATWTAIALTEPSAGTARRGARCRRGAGATPPMLETMFATANGGNDCGDRLGRGAAPMTRPPSRARSAADPSRDRGERVLEEAAGDAADGRQDDDRRRRDPELVDDREVDERVQRRLAVDQRVLDRQQAERDAGCARRLPTVRRSLHASSVAWAAAARRRSEPRTRPAGCRRRWSRRSPPAPGIGVPGSVSARSHAADDAG